MSIQTPGWGEMTIWWEQTGIVDTGFVPISMGYFSLPGELKKRDIKVGSSVHRNGWCLDSTWQYILVLDGGELTGCAN